MFSYYVFILGILVGAAVTMLIREISNAHILYKDRKQAEFEAAVAAAAAHRRNQAERDWDAMLGNVDPTKQSTVRKYQFDSSEDPFA